VDAVSANGSDASWTRIDLFCAAWLCTAWPSSWAKVKTSLDLPVKFTKTYGVIFGVRVLQNAPSLFPGLTDESIWFSLNIFLANSSRVLLNFQIVPSNFVNMFLKF
jgi:hypothetical protein